MNVNMNIIQMNVKSQVQRSVNSHWLFDWIVSRLFVTNFIKMSLIEDATKSIASLALSSFPEFSDGDDSGDGDHDSKAAPIPTCLDDLPNEVAKLIKLKQLNNLIFRRS